METGDGGWNMKVATDDNIDHGTAQLEDCLCANILRFEDGFVLCPIIWSGGDCNECMEQFERRLE